MVLPHSSTQKYLFTLGGQFAAARGGQYDRLLHVIAHNHPSGNLEASEEDLKLTKRIKEAGELLDVRLIDHLILGIFWCIWNNPRF